MDVYSDSESSGASDDTSMAANAETAAATTLQVTLSSSAVEVTAEEHEKGADIQGFEWATLPISRHQYRSHRLRTYVSYTSTPASNTQTTAALPEDQNIAAFANREFYRFHYTKLLERPAILHFQLRHLMQCTSKHDVFYVQHTSIRHWNAITHRSRTVIDWIRTPSTPGLTRVDGMFRVTCMAARDGILTSGGFFGEVVWTRIRELADTHPSTVSSTVLTEDPNGITNHVAVTSTRSGTQCLLTSSNDFRSRLVNTQTGQITQEFQLPYAVNCSAMSPDRSLIACAGDHEDVRVLDTQSGSTIYTLQGHTDHSYACSFNPTPSRSWMLVTGNQDKTARVWDMRNAKRAVAVLRGKMAAIRNVTFTESSGEFLMLAEATDFVHIYDASRISSSTTSMSSTSAERQTIDMFGEIAGVDFTPDGEGLFIANADEVYGGVLEYRRKRWRYSDGVV